MDFTWTALIPGVGHEKAHVATAGIVSGLMIMTAVVARARLGRGEEAVMPSAKFSLRGFFEIIVEYIQNLSNMVIGHHGEKFLPMFTTIFFFILINNFVGILPGMAPATENINTTIALGGFSFVMYNYYGFKENGLAYLKHFLGPVIWLAFLMLPIELISHLARPLSLGLRLANVMGGDHRVVGVFLDIFGWGLPIPFYLLGMFIAFIQAFVFTLLSMVYVSMATAHDQKKKKKHDQ